ncbi:ABC transporter substrate-binding protein [Haloimpatiens lingqiaonensis]|uniref:ABC transporter substrate-binding protein n=1 Tax=Haloimpatiens lingqiaonensis TaxID=1380675 RepID=UPI0010FD109F|nr:ABC transporter substrate-binding protein [Haloimpatiens lingqiaonensis]
MKNFKKFISSCLFLVMLFSLAACSNKKTDSSKTKEDTKISYPLKIKDSYDREVSIEKEPAKIVSLAPNITETIFALGKGDKLVGKTDYCDYPEASKKIESVGGLKNPNIEKIAQLKPDLVVASTHFDKKVLQKLEALNIKTVVLYGKDNLDGAYSVIDKLGTILNAKEKSNEIVSSMKKKVESIKEKVKGKSTPSVYYVISYGKFGDYTAGGDTFINELIETAGGKNVASDVKGWQYSIEKLIEKNPDIVICSKYFDAKKGIENANGYKDLTAVKNNKLYEIDNNLLDRQGPRLADGLEELAKIIHPELFK